MGSSASTDSGTGRPILRLLRTSDIPLAQRLKDAAGWNQTAEDWTLLLDLFPEGCFALEKGGALIATSVAIPYEGPFGWVGMMLVHPDERRQGHGARMLAAAVSFLKEKGVLPALDATPLGKPLYERHGFRDLFAVERRVGTGPAGRSPHPGCIKLDAGALEKVLPLDREGFGADRSALLRGLLRRRGALGFAFHRGGAIEGFLLARPGSRFFHIGPWVASTREAAGALLDTALSALAGTTVGIDVPAPNEAARGLAAEAGLETARTLARMVLTAPGQPSGDPPAGAVPPGGDPKRIFGLAGLEWG